MLAQQIYNDPAVFTLLQVCQAQLRRLAPSQARAQQDRDQGPIPLTPVGIRVGRMQRALGIPDAQPVSQGVADHFVTQMLRQGDAVVFKRYRQAKLNMMREVLDRLDRRANEHRQTFGTGEPM